MEDFKVKINKPCNINIEELIEFYECCFSNPIREIILFHEENLKNQIVDHIIHNSEEYNVKFISKDKIKRIIELGMSAYIAECEK